MIPTTLMTVEESASYLQTNPYTIRKWLLMGKLPGFKIGRQWRIDKKELDDLVESLKGETHGSSFEGKKIKEDEEMGTLIKQRQAKFFIPQSNFGGVLDAVGSLMNQVDRLRMGSNGFSWVDTQAVVKAVALGDIKGIFKSWRWEATLDKVGVRGISFTGEKKGQDDLFFKSIAPFVKRGSFIEMEREHNPDESGIWSWYFDGKHMIETIAKLSFHIEDSQEIDSLADKLAFLLSDDELDTLQRMLDESNEYFYDRVSDKLQARRPEVFGGVKTLQEVTKDE